MYLKLTSSALALALSTNTVAVASSINRVALTSSNQVNSSTRQKEGDNTSHAKLHRQTKQVDLSSTHVTNGSQLDNADVGALGRKSITGRPHRGNDLFSSGPRFLQEGNESYAACAKRDTCEPALCQCVADGGRGFTCAAELDALCNGISDANGKEWTIGGCVSDIVYYENLYCPFAKCAVEGGAYESCACTFYDESCAAYKDDPVYKDDEEVLLHCAVDSCCKSIDDDGDKAKCFKYADTATPSGMPSGPTTSPTTSAPTETSAPTVTPPASMSAPTVTPPASTEAEAATRPATDPVPIGDTSPTRPTPSGKPLTSTSDGDKPDEPKSVSFDTSGDESESGTKSTGDFPATVSFIGRSSAQTVSTWGIAGATIAATLVWSISM